MTTNYVHTVVLPPTEDTSTLAQGSLFFVGTATLLIRYAGFTILTDPNFLHPGELAHLGLRQRFARIANPAIDFAALPPVDLVLLSHLHEDHFDRRVLRKLAKNMPIVTTPQAAHALVKKRFQILHALETWQTLSLVKGAGQLNITALPGKHAPGFLSAAFPAVMGSMLEFQVPDEKNAYRIYISGDTLIHRQMRQIPRRFPEIDLAILHLGGEMLYGIQTTMDGKQGIEALKLINAKETVPVHYNDYPCFTSSLEDFRLEVTKAKLERRVRYLGRGDAYSFRIPN
ncbi:MAG TPA: MBL fold metallo-hydrolase [Ktedonobacteraceae bacterium]|jgi:L-ascorbate metabolism protein UlaG (beta-lactamase superfamily)|nr:MBL fold metallo-hydrolase [Ktedonobacteraceae bacterium]